MTNFEKQEAIIEIIRQELGASFDNDTVLISGTDGKGGTTELQFIGFISDGNMNVKFSYNIPYDLLSKCYDNGTIRVILKNRLDRMANVRIR